MVAEHRDAADPQVPLGGSSSRMPTGTYWRAGRAASSGSGRGRPRPPPTTSTSAAPPSAHRPRRCAPVTTPGRAAPGREHERPERRAGRDAARHPHNEHHVEGGWTTPPTPRTVNPSSTISSRLATDRASPMEVGHPTHDDKGGRSRARGHGHDPPATGRRRSRRRTAAMREKAKQDQPCGHVIGGQQRQGAIDPQPVQARSIIEAEAPASVIPERQRSTSTHPDPERGRIRPDSPAPPLSHSRPGFSRHPNAGLETLPCWSTGRNALARS